MWSSVTSIISTVRASSAQGSKKKDEGQPAQSGQPKKLKKEDLERMRDSHPPWELEEEYIEIIIDPLDWCQKKIMWEWDIKQPKKVAPKRPTKPKPKRRPKVSTKPRGKASKLHEVILREPKIDPKKLLERFERLKKEIYWQPKIPIKWLENSRGESIRLMTPLERIVLPQKAKGK